ncbi:DUF4189 domain-containing protein [Pseudomonas sp. CGJS7]|uniref:DUF4189 domain-containing protein n=1 Tax=Pseudomonas sp. CGJS7 TaxID=3109348 RepID=UPI00300BBFA7
MKPKQSRQANAARIGRAGGWLLLPALLALSWGAQAQCAGPMGAQQYNECFTMNVILPQQQRQREEAERNREPPRPPTAEEIAAAERAQVAREGWGAYAASPGLAQIGQSSDLTSQSKAEKAALKDCEKRGGRGCSVLSAVQNECLVLARNHGGAYALATAKTDVEAAKQALQQCNQKSPDQVCRFHSPMLCPGLGVAMGGVSNDSARYARDLETEFDQRPYWGAVASGGGQLYFVANATSAKLASERALADCGADCKLLAANKRENECLVAAWVPGAAAAPMVIESHAVAGARVEALRQCAGATGQMCAASQASCSSRERVAENGDGTVSTTMSTQNARAEDLRESLQPWVGMRGYGYRILWSQPDKFDDGGNLLATRRTLTYNYAIPAGRGRPARPCSVIWSEVDDKMESYTLKGEGCRFLFK